MAEVAFIGVGNMGAGMAANLLKAGYAVTVYDLDAARMAPLVEAGAMAADSIAGAVRAADAVITMLPAGKHVAEVYRDHILHVARPGALLIDCSTIDIATARATAQQAADAGFAMLDAPVSGGVAGAAAGTLAFMVGGEAEGFTRGEPILQAMGKKIVHCGASGAGQAAKVCNNLMLAIQMISVAEGFRLAEGLGLSAQTLFDVSSAASGQCWSLTSYCPVAGVGPQSPADNDFRPGFAAALMAKDLGLAADAAASVGLDLEFMARALARYRAMMDAGEGGMDFSAVIRTIGAEPQTQP